MRENININWQCNIAGVEQCCDNDTIRHSRDPTTAITTTELLKEGDPTTAITTTVVLKGGAVITALGCNQFQIICIQIRCSITYHMYSSRPYSINNSFYLCL